MFRRESTCTLSLVSRESPKPTKINSAKWRSRRQKDWGLITQMVPGLIVLLCYMSTWVGLYVFGCLHMCCLSAGMSVCMLADWRCDLLCLSSSVAIAVLCERMGASMYVALVHVTFVVWVLGCLYVYCLSEWVPVWVLCECRGVSMYVTRLQMWPM